MQIFQDAYTLDLFREPGEPRVFDELRLFYRLRNVLREPLGLDVSLMVSGRVYYIRSKNRNEPEAFAVYDPHYQVRDASKLYDQEGKVALRIERLSGHGYPNLRALSGPIGPLEWWPEV